MVSSNKLEVEERDFLTDEDLYEGAQVIWRYKGLPYDAQVLQAYGEYLDVKMST